MSNGFPSTAEDAIKNMYLLNLVPEWTSPDPYSLNFTITKEYKEIAEQIKIVRLNAAISAKKEIRNRRNHLFSKPENFRLKDESNNPNFARIFSQFSREDFNYGKIHGVIVPSINSKLEYLFLYNSDGKIWIANLEIADSNILKYGIKQKADAVPNEIALPAQEYSEYIPIGFDDYNPKRVYGGPTSYLDKIPIIRDFRKHFGIQKKY